MIVRESNEAYIMVEQHIHACLSGNIALNFNKHLFVKEGYAKDVILAIYEHDRSWIRLDDHPIWNDQVSIPFSFMDFPLLQKLLTYTDGINEVEYMNSYAGLLCSLHYSSFQHLKTSNHPECVKFYRGELERQQRIKAKLHDINEMTILLHLQLLQLCDELSLYVCLNEPGAIKENEYPWYREGFETLIDGQKFNARWVSNQEITIFPFPFEQDFRVTLRAKHISKGLRDRIGIDAAYKDTMWTEQEIWFVRRDY